MCVVSILSNGVISLKEGCISLLHFHFPTLFLSFFRFLFIFNNGLIHQTTS